MLKSTRSIALVAAVAASIGLSACNADTGTTAPATVTQTASGKGGGTATPVPGGGGSKSSAAQAPSSDPAAELRKLDPEALAVGYVQLPQEKGESFRRLEAMTVHDDDVQFWITDDTGQFHQTDKVNHQKLQGTQGIRVDGEIPTGAPAPVFILHGNFGGTASSPQAAVFAKYQSGGNMMWGGLGEGPEGSSMLVASSSSDGAWYDAKFEGGRLHVATFFVEEGRPTSEGVASWTPLTTFTTPEGGFGRG